jgi:poly(3-hydroxybutyrate) depolymerase
VAKGDTAPRLAESTLLALLGAAVRFAGHYCSQADLMRNRLLVLRFVSSAVSTTLLVGACGAGDASAPSGVGTPGAAGTGGSAGSSSAAGTAGAGGMLGRSGSPGAAGANALDGGGASSVAGSAGSGGSSAGGTSKGTPGCGMDPQPTDSQTTWVKHDIEVTGVDQAFIDKYPPNAGKTYNWTHRNYFLRLPTDYDSSKPYPITIGTSGCGGPETVGSEGGYAPLGTAPGETDAIQVALSYVVSSAANADCGGAVFADDFPNSPEPQYLAAVVKDVQAKYCTDSAKVFLSGYSSGAFESITLGCASSDILRGYGIQIGGGLRQNGPMPCKGPIAAMYVVGLQDTENPIGPLQTPLHDSLGSAPARDEVLSRNGCVGDAHEPWDPDYPMCEKYTGCPAEYPVVWCAITSGHLPDQKDPAVGKYRYDGLWKFWSSLP